MMNRLHHSALRALGFFFLLTIAWTWPLVTRLSSRIPHDVGDPLLNTWILWWNTQAVPFTEAWWSPPFFYPMAGAFALSEHLAGVALFTAPLHVLGVNALAAYNVALILSCWLSGFFAFLLGRRLTGSAWAGLLAGVAFGFAPYRASQLSHLQVLTAQWMPLALYAMHRYLDDRRRRWLVLFGAAWVIQALSNGYYLLFFPVLIALWLAWFVDWRRAPRRGLALAGTFAASSLLLVPTLLRYRAVHGALGLTRTREEMQGYSATFGSFIETGHMLAFWTPDPTAPSEAFLFPGLTVAALLLAGASALLWSRRLRDAVTSRSPAMFYAGAALLLWWLCFGPSESDSVGAVVSRPYTVLTWLPGFSGLRVPARFAMLAALCAAIAAAIAAARLAPAVRWQRRAAGGVLAAGLFVDGWIRPMPLEAPPARVVLPDAPNAPVLELPADDLSVDVPAMYRAMLHGRPLVNGFSGHRPPHYALLATSLMRGDPSPLTYLAAGRPLIVIVHRRLDPRGAWRALVEQAGGALHEESGTGPVYVVTPNPRPRTPALGQALGATAAHTGDGAVLDLGAPQLVRGVTINLRWRHAEVDARMRVDISVDGNAWVTAWDDWTGAPALAAALEDQRVVPMRIYLPDVRARFIRLSPIPAWVAQESTVHAPR
ncbi:MAG: hypothetical protein WEB50_11060 [Vicinamibacterales bacterium]